MRMEVKDIADNCTCSSKPLLCHEAWVLCPLLATQLAEVMTGPWEADGTAFEFDM